MKLIIAILGSTGNVGREIVKILNNDVNFFSSCNEHIRTIEIIPIASAHSSGKEINIFGQNTKVKSLDEFMQSNVYVDVLFSCASSEISQKYISQIQHQARIIIDKTEYFRNTKPLIVPEINAHLVQNLAIQNSNQQNPIDNIFSSPNCVAIPIIITMNTIKNYIKRLVISTYQSISGAGLQYIDQFEEEIHNYLPFLANYKNNQHTGNEIFNKSLAFNTIPQIGSMIDHNTSEEEKIINEVQKVLNEKIKISITSVRVPTIIGHGMTINVELKNLPNNIQKENLVSFITNKLSKQDGLIINDQNGYTTTAESINKNEVFVGRIRIDHSLENTISMWVTCDNIRKGAALNALQTAKIYVKNLL